MNHGTALLSVVLGFSVKALCEGNVLKQNTSISKASAGIVNAAGQRVCAGAQPKQPNICLSHN